MKNIISRLLLSGICKTGRCTAADIIRKFYPMQYLIVDNPYCKGIICNGNDFWRFGNNEKRLDLYRDLLSVKRWSVADPAYYKCLNRFENGDGYGIIRKDGEG